MSVLAFVIDDTSFDQDRLLPVELLVGFTRLDKLCSIRSPDMLSIGTSAFGEVSSSQIESVTPLSVILSVRTARIASEPNSHFGVS